MAGKVVVEGCSLLAVSTTTGTVNIVVAGMGSPKLRVDGKRVYAGTLLFTVLAGATGYNNTVQSTVDQTFTLSGTAKLRIGGIPVLTQTAQTIVNVVGYLIDSPYTETTFPIAITVVNPGQYKLSSM